MRNIAMKHAKIIGVIAILLLTMATPSKAMAQSWWDGFATAPQANSFWQWLQQYPGMAAPLYQNPYQIYDPSWRAQYPQFQQYINNNPGWWNSLQSLAPQYYDDPFNQFLSEHPKIAADLRQNPGLIYDPAYRAAHPALKNFLASHKRIWRAIKYQNYAYSNSNGWGTYNNNGQWSDQNWWRQNGDWDNQGQWRDRAWWQTNNRKLAQQRHPEWFTKQPARRVSKPETRQGKRGHGDGDAGKH
jgi:hypothetical protein